MSEKENTGLENMEEQNSVEKIENTESVESTAEAEKLPEIEEAEKAPEEEAEKLPEVDEAEKPAEPEQPTEPAKAPETEKEVEADRPAEAEKLPEVDEAEKPAEPEQPTEPAKAAETEKAPETKGKKKLSKPVIGVIVAVAVVCCGFGGFKAMQASNYKSATALYEDKNYADAATKFEKLGNYKDSADLADECNFQNAVSLLDDGQYEDALAIFEKLGDYKTSSTHVIDCKVGKARELVAAGDYDGAKELVADYSDDYDAKRVLATIDIKENGMDGLATFVKDNIEANSQGNPAESVTVADKYNVLVYYDTSEQALMLEMTEKDRNSGDPLLDLTLSGKNAGQYHYMYSKLNKVNALYALYNDSLYSDGSYYTGIIINAYGKVNLKKFTSKTGLKFSKYYLTSSSDGTAAEKKSLKTNCLTLTQGFVQIGLDGVQQFCNDQGLDVNLKDLGIKKYKTVNVTANIDNTDNTDATDATDATKKSEDSSSDSASASSGSLVLKSKYGKVEFTGLEKGTKEYFDGADVDPEDFVFLKFKYTNLCDEDNTFQDNFQITVYQNGVEINEATTGYSSGNDQGDLQDAFFNSVMKDGTNEFGWMYELKDNSPITIKVTDSDDNSESTEVSVK